MRCVRTATHKYIVNFEVSTAVDVPADVRESLVYPQLVAEFGRVRDHIELYDLLADLQMRLLLWMRQTHDPLLQGPVASPYYYESLRRLGELEG